ncbi:MAG TPA: hypothetical protein VHU83_09010 [Bryobacteraceae bacterium]|jgi:DNA-binding phage protein|nr:hypothetical protein [Bryobacteraceae bacterium]
MNDYKADLLEDLKDVEYAARYLSAAYNDSIDALLIALRDVGEATAAAQRLLTVSNP